MSLSRGTSTSQTLVVVQADVDFAARAARHSSRRWHQYEFFVDDLRLSLVGHVVQVLDRRLSLRAHRVTPSAAHSTLHPGDSERELQLKLHAATGRDRRSRATEADGFEV